MKRPSLAQPALARTRGPARLVRRMPSLSPIEEKGDRNGSHSGEQQVEVGVRTSVPYDPLRFGQTERGERECGFRHLGTAQLVLLIYLPVRLLILRLLKRLTDCPLSAIRKINVMAH